MALWSPAYLSLASCPGLQPRFLSSLRRLPKLASLDLSYTYITGEHLAAAFDGVEGGGGEGGRDAEEEDAEEGEGASGGGGGAAPGGGGGGGGGVGAGSKAVMSGLRALHLAVCKGVDDAAARHKLTDATVLPNLEDLDLTHVPLSADVLREVVAGS